MQLAKTGDSLFNGVFIATGTSLLEYGTVPELAGCVLDISITASNDFLRRISPRVQVRGED
jgi:hypothetical protein